MSTSVIPPEGEILAENKRNRLAFLAGIAMAFLPALAAVTYLSTGLSFSEENALFKAQTDNALQQRTQLIETDIAAINDGVEKVLSDPFIEQNPQTLVRLIPGATEIKVIPLGDMGVASLDPKDYGLTSLVLLDSVRKAFETGDTMLEVVKTGEIPKLVAVGRFTTPSKQGVAVVTFDGSVLARWLSVAPIGEFTLWQKFADAPSRQIVAANGASTSESIAKTNRTIRETPYVLGLRVDRSLMPTAPVLPLLFWPLMLAGIVGSYWVLVVRRHATLESDVKRILDTADSREAVTLQHSELYPIAFTIRQLASNNKNRIQRSPSAAPAIDNPIDQSVIEPEPSELTSIASGTSEGWTFNGSWLELTDSQNESAELDALKKLASGIGGFISGSSARSFVISYLGGEAEMSAKTAFIKALLSEGVDIIDLGAAPPPVAHMATHNGTSSGAALMIQRDGNETIKVGAVNNRKWAGEAFWRKVIGLSSESIATSSDGRSIKLDLINDYCDRLSADMAMAASLDINIVCDNPVTLAVAEKCLMKASCEVHSVCLDPGFTSEDAQSVFENHKASLSFILDSHASRLTVFDEHANRVRDDHVFMLISQDVLARHPGSDVIIGSKSSRALPSFITSCGGASKFVDTAPHVLQSEMAETGAVVGGDCNGAFYLRDRWFGSEDAIYAAARLTEIVSNEGALTELLSTLPETSLIVLPLRDKRSLHVALFSLLAEEANFAGARVSQINGIRVDFADSWVHIDDVGSSSEPSLRIEGDDDSCRSRLEGLISELLSRDNPELSLTFPTSSMTTLRSP